jgi:asparagine synthase (glutamine-hydrolysing)
VMAAAPAAVITVFYMLDGNDLGRPSGVGRKQRASRVPPTMSRAPFATSAAAISFTAGVPASLREGKQRRLRVALRLRENLGPVHERAAVGATLFTTGDPAEVPGRTYLSYPEETQSDDLHAPGAILDVTPERVGLSTDHLGMKHLYWVQDDGYVAVSTSAAVLASLADSGLDELSIAHAALLGFPLGNETMFRGVHKVPGGGNVSLAGGVLTHGQRSGPAGDVIRSGAAAIRRAVQELLAANPDASLELSGGLDSRLILAALPQEARRGRVALTVGPEDGADVMVARQLAGREGLDHVVIRGAAEAEDGADAARRRVEDAARSRDFMANPLAGAITDRVETMTPPGPRFSGVNGEYARGFYYPGTLPWGSISPSAVDRLLRWRMLTNERVADALFVPGWLAAQTRSLSDLLRRELTETGLPLRPATDEFYLQHRVLGWGGPAYSHAVTQRTVLAPFLHPAFLDWAAATKPTERAGSRAMASALGILDPGLAGVPLAGGLRPRDLATRGAISGGRKAMVIGTKAGRKLYQRVSGLRRPPGGVGQLLPQVLRSWAERPPFDGLEGHAFIDQGQLSRWNDDPTRIDASTASFLANLSGSTSFLDLVSSTADGRAATPRR